MADYVIDHSAILSEEGNVVITKLYSDTVKKNPYLKLEYGERLMFEQHVSAQFQERFEAGFEFPVTYGNTTYRFFYKRISARLGKFSADYKKFTDEFDVQEGDLLVFKVLQGGMSVRIFIVRSQLVNPNLVKDVFDVPRYRLDFFPQDLKVVALIRGNGNISTQPTNSVQKIYQDFKEFNGLTGLHTVGFTTDIGFSKVRLSNCWVFLVGRLTSFSLQDAHRLRGMLNEGPVVIFSQHGFKDHLLGSLLYQLAGCPFLILGVCCTTIPPIEDISCITDANITPSQLTMVPGFSPHIDISENAITVGEFTDSPDVPQRKLSHTQSLAARSANLASRHSTFHI